MLEGENTSDKNLGPCTSVKLGESNAERHVESAS